MVTIREGNLFDATEGIICHQVNCMGVMGVGTAAQFKKEFPDNYELYRQVCVDATNPRDLLGKIVFLGEDNTRYSCSMFAQVGYGRDKHFTYTDYDAFYKCCEAIAYTADAISSSHKVPINMPYGIGCGLANGDWHIIYKIIEEVFKDFNVIIWKLKEN